MVLSQSLWQHISQIVPTSFQTAALTGWLGAYQTYPSHIQMTKKIHQSHKDRKVR